MNTPVSFSSDGAEIISRNSQAKLPVPTEQFRNIKTRETFYEVNRCVAFIKENGYRRVALQFPDSLLEYSAWVTVTLRKKTNQDVFIMADTSYGSCCVDEVTAKHVQADCIIHYGASCLTETRRLPVLYIFGDMPIDIDHCTATFRELFRAKETHILVLYDTTYTHCIGRLRKELSSDFSNCVFSTLDLQNSPTLKTNTAPCISSMDVQPSGSIQNSQGLCGCVVTGNVCCESPKVQSNNLASKQVDLSSTSNSVWNKMDKDKTQLIHNHNVSFEQYEEEKDTEEQIKVVADVKLQAQQPLLCVQEHLSYDNQLCRKIARFGRLFTLACSMDNYKVFYIGEEGQTLTNFMLNYNKCQFYSYNPIDKMSRRETFNVNKALARRYYLMQKAKEARTVGVLVGTLGAADYLQSIQRLKTIMKEAGKKYYTIAVGKLNVPKLANFMEIDVFVLVACPENSLLASREFYKPVVTPLEMEIACIRSREWSEDYTTDFRELLPGALFHLSDVKSIGTVEASEPEYSLITGGLLPCKESRDVSSTALVERSSMDISLQHSTGAEFLSNRTWRGLEQQLCETKVTMAVQGKSGLPARYSHEAMDS